MYKIKVSPFVASKIDGLRKTDFRVQFFKASGPGGQHRNKTSTAARITHIKTGISAEATDSRSQADNRANAFKKLINKLIEHYESMTIAEERKINSGWAEKIRTYHQPRGTVTDHRSGVAVNYDDAMNGEIDDFINAMFN